MQYLYLLTIVFASLAFVFLSFKKLRSFNFREEEVFDLVLVNAVIFSLVVWKEIWWLVLLPVVFNVVIVKLRIGWSYSKTLLTFLSTSSLFFALTALGGFLTRRYSLAALPLSVALFLIFVLSYGSHETVEAFFARNIAKLKKKRKEVYRAKKGA